MGNPKKGKKGKAGDNDAFGDDLLEEVEALEKVNSDRKKEENGNPVNASGAVVAEEKKSEGGKKSKKKKKKNDWDPDSLADEVEAIKLESKTGASAIVADQKPLAATTIEDAETLPAAENDNEAPLGKKSKKKKKKKEKFNEEDLLDEVSALEGKEPLKPVVNESEDSSDRKEISDRTVNKESAVNVVDDRPVEGEFVMKTAAQKKAEKKERDRKKKEQERQQRRQKEEEKVKKESKEQSSKDDEDNVGGGKQASEKDEECRETEEPTAEETEGESKKKKKKKKKADKEDEKKKKKKPASTQLKAMQELLKQAQDEKARLLAEEEGKARAFEKTETKRLEAVRLEKEKREKKKIKEKERIERQKAEGTYLTKHQKEAKRRAEEKLAALREQGIIIPEKAIDGPKQKVRYGTRQKKKKINQSDDKTSDLETETSAEVIVEIEDVSMESESKDNLSSSDGLQTTLEEETVEEEDVKDSWEALSDQEEEEEDTKDNWDDEDEEDSEEESVKDKSKARTETKQKASDISREDQESNDDDDEEEEEDSESESSETETESESESDSEDISTSHEDSRLKAENRIKKRREENEANISLDNLRCPVICVLGHVDTGKTKILDKIRHTSVQDGEAGGITQQIGTTMVPEKAIREQTKMCRQFTNSEMKVDGMLIIDTPGHESFSNLRSRGSSLCDFAILVVDIMHGLEPQTIESINLLKSKKTPFVVALNKIDRLYEWKSSPHTDVQNTLKKQKKNTKDEFDERVKVIITEFAEQSLNAALYFENSDPRTYISLVPTSAHSGDGMGSLMALIIELCQSMLSKRLAFSEELQCTSMEVKALTGLGTTMDVVLVNGRLRESDTIVVAGQEGPIVTQIRGLLTTQPLKELRVKNQYIKHKEIKGAQGIKLMAKDLDKALAGLPVLVAEHPDEVEILKEEVAELLQQALQCIKLSDRGVHVQASTLGSLEALLEFLKSSKIPYAGINIGPVHKKDVVKASVMLEHDGQYAVILAFDVKIERDAQEMADRDGIKVFQADIIYHLFDSFMKYRDELKAKKRAEFKHVAVFPCKLRVIPEFIFNARNPIVVGVQVEAGIVKEGTPIIIPTKENLEIGVVSSVEANHKQVPSARKGQEVCVKIENVSGDAPKMYGRHFDHTDILISKISRESIDAVKEYFRDDLEKSDWQLMIELKKILEII